MKYITKMHRLCVDLILIALLFVAGIAHAQTESFPQSRPDAENGPTKILISFYILDIEDIDNKDQSFTADVIIRLRWHDQRLSEANGAIPLSAIWHPNIQIFNLRDIETRFPESVTVSNDGTIQRIGRKITSVNKTRISNRRVRAIGSIQRI
jgi:hypothetical protein